MLTHTEHSNQQYQRQLKESWEYSVSFWLVFEPLLFRLLTYWFLTSDWSPWKQISKLCVMISYILDSVPKKNWNNNTFLSSLLKQDIRQLRICFWNWIENKCYRIFTTLFNPTQQKYLWELTCFITNIQQN